MALSEIEKLENRWRENKQGLTFAPLAEAYRKSGDPQRALDVLKPGLELHPDYIPASIVLGRCHLDLGDDGAAEGAFSHVLSLDPENVIALKALAEVSERHARYGDAERWLQTLISVDRSNDEARGQLARMSALRAEHGDRPATAEGTATEAGESVASPETADTVELLDDLAPADAPEAAETIEPLVEEPIEMVAAPADDLALETTPAADPDLALTPDAGDWAHPEAQDTPIAGFEPTGFVSPADVASESIDGIELEQPVTFDADHEMSVSDRADIGLEQSEEIVLRPSASHEYQTASDAEELGSDGLHTGHTEYQLPSTADELTVPDVHDAAPAYDAVADEHERREIEALHLDESESGAPLVEMDEDPEPPQGDELREQLAPTEGADDDAIWSVPHVGDSEEAPLPTIDADETAPATAEASAEAPVADMAMPAQLPADEAEPDLVVTETMAELYVRQGHVREAVRVYRELSERDPGDRRLAARLQELEDEAHEAQRVSAAPAAAPAAAPTPAQRYAARETGGRSVADLLRGVLDARPTDVEQSARRGAASAAAGTPPAVTEPAVPPSEPPSTGEPDASGGAPTRPAPDHLSLSAVFGDDVSPVPPAVRPANEGQPAVSFDEFFGGPAQGGNGGTGASRTRSVRGRPGDEDDLDQFHAWLQNLKR
jgi:tetratricopeptide (TPR) repeat protein